jgi:6-phosphofructokinase
MTKRIGLLTSGGDAQGMNAAVRSVVRTALDRGLEVHAIYEGYQGLVDDGDYIRKMDWDSVGGILQFGGTMIGSARCEAFMTREGRRTAAKNLVKAGIDGLIVIGGDGSLTGANVFRQEWTELISELAERGEITAEEAAACPNISIVGLVGSIDNDFSGTDMTIGTDTALHRITEAVDAITSTAASHQRTFVVKVMGRNCGYLALMGALACGADWVLIPESPPDVENWQDVLVERLKAGRKAGRRDSIVILAEGARDREGNYIGSSDVQRLLEERLGEEVRITVLGHVQRGGRPSAYDRILGTMMGHEAVNTLLNAAPDDEPVVIGIRNNRMTRLPLMESVKKTQAVTEAVEAKDFERAMSLRSSSFKDAFLTFKTMVERERFPAFNLPIVCLPASINNNLPGSELSIGSDSALNNIVGAVDKIKTSAVASQRCFVVEVMGRRCGYLALLSGLATGAERVYMHEDGVTLADLQRDLEMLRDGFRHGKRLGLLIRNEDANPFYTTAFMCALFEQEGGDLFDVRQAILGHLQQGGDPSPFDRIEFFIPPSVPHQQPMPCP